ncbi:threonine/serine ThrE exporter family protein [Rudaeicoccus suwonensis]|uniref:Uncharacterized membrane protein YjjP (DUF1212 family) n=1 Tax=Rudaeicoccus suwonensis TaxID=657409 RepID=A0A561E844_9MICO|nr:threonine/serine exporter family protein [Rudaeicoccus suwonensis]TWE11788.1 uncharacterized membrane protein YjjP (DUF1212 family) [Rudaeicoccus suwonensis]
MPEDQSSPRRHLPGQELRTRAGRTLRARSTPRFPVGAPGDENGPADLHARQVIDLSLRVGEAMLATGASAADVTALVLRMTRAYGVRSVQVDVTYTSLTISYHRGALRDPMTVMRIVPASQVDYSRLEQLHDLVREVTAGSLDPAAARNRLETVLAAPHPYYRITVTCAMGLLGAAVAALLGGDLLLIVLCGVIAAVVDRAQRWLSMHGIAAFFCQAIGAAIPTSIALGINTLGEHGWHVWRHEPASVVVASGVVVLLAGLSLVSAAQDTIDGFYVTASARLMEVILLSGGVVLGVIGTLALAKRLGARLAISPAVSFSPHLLLAAVAAAAISAAFAITAYAGRRATALAAVAGAVAWVVYEVAEHATGSAPAASAVAALIVGVFAQAVAWRFRVPALAVATSGIVVLLPGLAVYRGVFQIVQHESSSAGMNTLFGAAAIGLALASGVTLGALPSRVLRADRTQKRIMRRSLGDTRN